jgi:hypothetical protein
MTRVWLAVTVLAMAVVPSAANAATIIDFQDVASGQCNFSGPSLSSRGFSFTGNPADPSLYICDANTNAQNTTAALINANLTSEVIMTDGAAFSLQSFFAGSRTADHNTSTESSYYGTATGIRVTGTLAGGGTVQTTFALNGLHFDQFLLPSTFSNLTSVDFLALGVARSVGPEFVIDDIAVDQPQAVPEPASLLLLGTGIAGAITRARRRWLLV